MFLIETKTNSSRIGSVKIRLGFVGCFVVDAIGRKGGWLYYGRMRMELRFKTSRIMHKCMDP